MARGASRPPVASPQKGPHCRPSCALTGAIHPLGYFPQGNGLEALPDRLGCPRKALKAAEHKTHLLFPIARPCPFFGQPDTGRAQLPRREPRPLFVTLCGHRLPSLYRKDTVPRKLPCFKYPGGKGGQSPPKNYAEGVPNTPFFSAIFGRKMGTKTNTNRRDKKM